MKKIALFPFALSTAASYSTFANAAGDYQNECCMKKYQECQVNVGVETTCRKEWIACIGDQMCEM